MKTKDLLVGAALLGLSAALPTTSSAYGGDKSQEVQGKCHGINSCKGHGSCSGKGHGCAGQNSCKGKGWIKITEKECNEKGGKFEN